MLKIVFFFSLIFFMSVANAKSSLRRKDCIKKNSHLEILLLSWSVDPIVSKQIKTLPVNLVRFEKFASKYISQDVYSIYGNLMSVLSNIMQLFHFKCEGVGEH